MHVRLITYEPGQLLTSCYNVHVPMTASHYKTVPEPPRSRSNIKLMRYDVRGYASNTMLPRYAIAPPVLTLG